MSVSIKPTVAILVLSAAAVTAYAPVSRAFDFGNMMNPNRWFGGDRYNDRHDDPYWGDPRGAGPYGYGYPGVYGAPYGLPYGVPGFAVPPSGYGVMPVPAPAPTTAPAASPAVDPSEVEALKRRIEELEARRPEPSQPQAPERPSAPAFRPMNQY